MAVRSIEITRKEIDVMKKTIVLLLLLLTFFVPNVSSSQNGITTGSKDIDKLEILNIKNKLGDYIKELSVIKNNLKQIHTSMSASQAKERFYIIHSRENIENIQGIYMYVDNTLQEILLMKKDKIRYYRYLKEYEINQMRRLTNEYLNNIQRMHTQISNKTALHLIDKATETIHSSSELLDEAIEIVQQHSEQKKTDR